MSWTFSFNINQSSEIPILGINVKAYYSQGESVGKSFPLSIQVTHISENSNFDEFWEIHMKYISSPQEGKFKTVTSLSKLNELG